MAKYINADLCILALNADIADALEHGRLEEASEFAKIRAYLYKVPGADVIEKPIDVKYVPFYNETTAVDMAQTPFAKL